MNDYILEIKNLNVEIEGTKILEDVSFKIKQGEIVTIIGPNGSGKTTLAKCILNLLEPNSGTIWLKPGVNIGYTPQKVLLNQKLPIIVKNFLELSIKTKIDKTMVELIAEEIGIKKIIDRPLQKISGGELQKVLLARALLSKPGLLVLDEPAQGVDITGQLGFYKLIEKLCKENQISVLNISHDLFMVMKNTDYVICLNRHICCQGTPTFVNQQSNFHKLFGHEALSAFSIYEHNHNHTHDEI